MGNQKNGVKQVSFSSFLSRFEEVELPFTLSTDTHFEISKLNPPFPIAMVQQHIVPYEATDIDEFTEYVPCCKIPYTDDFHAIIYWKAMLMNYEYHLATFSLKGEFITKRTIGGTTIENGALTHKVVTIDEDWLIHIVEGTSKAETENYDPTSSKVETLELMDTGDIISFRQS